jgi:hypothetical protein
MFWPRFEPGKSRKQAIRAIAFANTVDHNVYLTEEWKVVVTKSQLTINSEIGQTPKK